MVTISREPVLATTKLLAEVQDHDPFYQVIDMFCVHFS